MERVRLQIQEGKKAVLNAVRKMVDGLCTHGISGLRKAVSFLRVRKLLEGAQRNLYLAAADTQKSVERVKAIGCELRCAGGPIQNAAKTAAGHQRQEVKGEKEGRFQSVVLAPLNGVRKTLGAMLYLTSSALDRVDRLETPAPIQTDDPCRTSPSEEQGFAMGGMGY